MPRTQALSFAIRTRPYASRPRPRIQHLQLHSNPFGHSEYNTPSTLIRRISSIHRPLTCRSSFPLQFALFHRRLTTFSSRSRPQAPYLSYPSYHDKSLQACLNRFIRNRYLTTARKQRLREQLRWQIRFQLYFWPVFFMFWMVWYGVQEIELEHDFPTPVEWGFRARWDGRNGKCVLWRISARGFAREGEWGLAYEYLSKLLERLENPRREGKRLKEQEVAGGNGALLVDGVGKIGYDINAKSEQWKQGYWECLMGLAKAAEYLDGHVKRKGKELNSKSKLYTWENIPGPQNPRPVAVPWDKDGAHLNVPTFNEVEPAMEAPEAYYLKILTSKGFSNRQRLDAALACADWYDYKNLRETAAGMYDWAIDIAAGGLPEGADHVVDIQTGVINAGKERFVSENLLRASTALGVWHAKHGEVKEALPIFLSVLRARKALPPAPPHFQSLALGQKRMSPAEREAQTTRSIVQGYLQNFIDFFRESDKLNVQTSGDEQPFHSLKEACEEVGVMTYIGEILFATGGQEREKGLSWTRDSVDAAEAVLWLMDDQGAGQGENGRDRCRECLSTGLENWQQMARQMTRLARQKKEEAQQSKGWLGLGIGQSSAVEKAAEEVKKWEEEEGQIELKRQKTASLLSILKPTGNPFGMISTVA